MVSSARGEPAAEHVSLRRMRQNDFAFHQAFHMNFVKRGSACPHRFLLVTVVDDTRWRVSFPAIGFSLLGLLHGRSSDISSPSSI